jgi:hypothetical protein
MHLRSEGKQYTGGGECVNARSEPFLGMSPRLQAKEEKELASKHQGELQKELCRLDGIIYGGKRGNVSSLSASKLSNSSLSVLAAARTGRADRGNLLDVSTRPKRRISARK